MPPALHVTPLAARRFMRRALGLDAPHADVAAAVAHHGYVQIDPINICGRMHDHILRHRVHDYREGDLMRHLHGAEGAPLPAETRTLFEHHLPSQNHILVAFQLDAWPHLLAAMRARTRVASAWSGRLTPRERELVPRLLAEIAARGPMGSEDFDDDRRAHRHVWGQSSLVKSALQKLFFHGRLLIAQRVHNRRRYDLPERVLPAKILARPEAPAAESARWFALLKLRQRRLATLKRDEVPLVADRVQPVVVDGADCPPLYCLRADAPLLEQMERQESRDGRASAPLLLAPLDPLVYDRRLARALWNFDYTWEAYTPAPKRARGYYALPVLAGTEFVGHVDPKADRANKKLVVLSRRVRRGHSVTTAIRGLAQFLGLH